MRLLSGIGALTGRRSNLWMNKYNKFTKIIRSYKKKQHFFVVSTGDSVHRTRQKGGQYEGGACKSSAEKAAI